MRRLLFFILNHFCFAAIISAQVNGDSIRISTTDTTIHLDTIHHKDSLPGSQIINTVSKKPGKDSGWQLSQRNYLSLEEFNRQILQHHPYYIADSQKTNIYPDKKSFKGKELLFYVIIFLVLIFAFLRRLFPKYFNDLFRLFFRTTLKQRQIREQLIQTPLPSLLFNGFFILSTALYIDFLLQHFNIMPVENFWLLFLYCSMGLSGIYFIKFLGLKISGWLFNIQEVTDSYIFIVFIVNKMIGICLLPLLVLLAFSQSDIYLIALTLSWCCIGALLIYRIILSFVAVRNQVKVNLFHFFLYLCAFEIAPLLLIYKVLLYLFQ